ncbi:Hypothetical predicted protein [Scomber scombrus]|uniref:Uncharacterized protein n=1 Tax=Scomber scombrus TaxID=13677 RepID=A0AAV1Q5Q0_SCOSC
MKQSQLYCFMPKEVLHGFLLLLLQNAPCSIGAFGSTHHLHHLLLLLGILLPSLSSPGSPPPSGPVPGLSEPEAPAEGGPGPGPPLAAALLCTRLPADLHRGDSHLHRAPEPEPRHGSVSAPGGRWQPVHSAGPVRGRALEGPDCGGGFRLSAGVCGGLMDERVILTLHHLMSPKTRTALVGEQTLKTLQPDR